MPTVQEVIKDPEFHGLPDTERVKVLDQIDPDFKSLPDTEKTKVVTALYEKYSKPVEQPKPDKPELPAQWKTNLSLYARPLLEGGGAMAGGVIGGAAGLPTGPGAILTGMAGGGLGYGIGKGAADLLDQGLGLQKPKDTMEEQLMQSAQDVGMGALFQGTGEAAIPLLKGVGSAIGKFAKPLMGRLSGVGTTAVNEAIKSGKQTGIMPDPFKSITSFDKALRGQITGEEVVDHARSALNSIKTQRSNAYRTQLNTISQNQQPIDIKPIRQKTIDLMNQYNITINRQGKLDTSRIAMGKTGRNDIEEIITTVAGWGKQQGDNTATGLDVLKRQLDDFYSDSSQARAFVTSLRDRVKQTIVDAVPEYEKMTSGYTEATKLIKDIESGLMLRKQGMTGRITADQTLRRLVSAMRDNFELRKELVDTLGSQGGKDLMAEISGHAMSSALPRGLAGTGPLLAGQMAYAHFVNPKFWPVIAASSPRVQGEFLRVFGKAMAETSKIPQQLVKEGVRQQSLELNR